MNVAIWSSFPFDLSGENDFWEVVALPGDLTCPGLEVIFLSFSAIIKFFYEYMGKYGSFCNHRSFQ